VKVRQLMDMLAEYSSEAEVRLLHQPQQPPAASLIGVVGESEIRECEGRQLGDDEAEIVYLLAGSQAVSGRSVVAG